MAFCRSEPPKVWEHLLLPLPLSLLWARTSHRVGRAFLKLQDHPAFNEGQAVPGLVMRTLVCPRAQQPPSLQAPSHPSVAPPGSHQLSRSFLLQPLECQHHTPGRPLLPRRAGCHPWEQWHPKLVLSWQPFTQVGTSGGTESSWPLLQQFSGSGTAPKALPSPQGPGQQPNLLSPCRKHNTDPSASVPHTRCQHQPHGWIQGRHNTCTGSLGGDTRPVSLPTFQPLQEMMHLSLAQTAPGESWAHLSSQGSGWGALHSLAVLLPRL